MIPGPTPVPEKVLQALGSHPIGHRSKEFQDLVYSTTQKLKWLHQTSNEVLTITGSGTAAMEALPQSISDTPRAPNSTQTKPSRAPQPQPSPERS